MCNNEVLIPAPDFADAGLLWVITDDSARHGKQIIALIAACATLKLFAK